MAGGGTHTGPRAGNFIGANKHQGKSLTLGEKLAPMWESTAKHLKEIRDREENSSMREQPSWDDND